MHSLSPLGCIVPRAGIAVQKPVQQGIDSPVLDPAGRGRHKLQMLTDLTPIDYLGILGSLMIAGAYLAVSRGWVRGEQPSFNLLNLFGSLFILASLYYRPNAGAILIELLWAIIAIVALTRWALSR